MNTEGEDWSLATGVWKHTDGTHGWIPVNRSDGRAFPDRLTPLERLHLVETKAGAQGESGAPSLYPIEFSFSPETGESLTKRQGSTSQPWMPPHGGAVRRPDNPQLVDIRGLRQTTHTLGISQNRKQGSGARRTPQDNADRIIAVPPPGHYEFAVGRFGADVDTLLAIEPEKGSLYLWLTGGSRWAPLNHSSGGTLAPSLLDHEHWNSELEPGSGEAGETKLFLPTASGLAVVCPDAVTLSYSVDYLGDDETLGAPVRWKGEIWVPLRDAAGLISLLSVNPDGQSPKRHATTIQTPTKLLTAPVCDARQIVWSSSQGQLVVSRKPDGATQATWLAWPSGIEPRFSFGSPYLSTTGNFWQLCWSELEDSYVFVQLGKAAPEIRPSNAPALCTGRRSFKMMTALRDPWDDPQDANHGNSNDVLIPLLESTLGGAVFGISVVAADGVTTLLESRERQTAVLHLRTDASSDLRFLTVPMSMPWLTRAFVFDGCLWAYHPELRSIPGTDLELK